MKDRTISQLFTQRIPQLFYHYSLISFSTWIERTKPYFHIFRIITKVINFLISIFSNITYRVDKNEDGRITEEEVKEVRPTQMIAMFVN